MTFSKMSTEALRSHLALHGWVPVAATTAALQQGTTRVTIVSLTAGFAVVVHSLAQGTEAPWGSIKRAHLVMLAERVATTNLERDNVI